MGVRALEMLLSSLTKIQNSENFWNISALSHSLTGIRVWENRLGSFFLSDREGCRGLQKVRDLTKASVGRTV